MNLLEGKVVVITGGAGLIGRAFTKGLIDKGVRVVIAEKDLEAATGYVDEQGWGKDQCIVLPIDITNKESILSVIENVVDVWGRVDGLVNNAYPRNASYGADIFDVKYEDFCENLSMNVGGYFLCMQLFSKFFSSIGSGSVVNIASIYGCVAPKFEIYDGLDMTMPVEYSAIKSSVIHLTKYMAKSLKGSGVRFNCLSPGGIFDEHDSRFVEAYRSNCLNKGMLDAEDLIGALGFLLSDDSKYMNGQNIIVDDGFTL